MLKKAFSMLRGVKTHWRAPAEGRYMPYREVFSLSFGGIGVRMIVYCVSQMILAANNALIGNTIGVPPDTLYLLYLLGVLSSFPLTGLRAKMIDNTRSMKGKYRPYLISMGIPTVVLGVAFVWMPYDKMDLFGKSVTVLLFNIGFQFFYNFFNDSYDSLINVLSPNSIERSDVLSIRSVVENLSPSIINIVFPLLAKAVTGEDKLFDLRIYRILFPPILLLGFLISLPVYFGTKEKLVRARSHVAGVSFADALRAVARNKYFWIISLAGWLGFLEGAFNEILRWMYNYQGAATAGQYSLITAIAGNASFWPNLVAPFLIRRYGKKKILIGTNLLNIGFIALMLPAVRMTGTPGAIWILLFFTFINQFISSLGHLLTPSVNADIRDYQQYVSGERIDGMFAAVGLIGGLISMGTGYVLPAIYKRVGLNAATAVKLGYTAENVYDVLYNRGYFVNICSVLILASVVGAALNVIPYFFYDLSETKQRAMVRILALRAAAEDRAAGTLTEEAAEKAQADVRAANEAVAAAGETDLNALADEYRATKDKTEKKELSSRLAEAKKTVAAGEEAALVLEELHWFGSDTGKAALRRAASVCEAGVGGCLTLDLPTKKEAAALPKTTPDERERRREALVFASELGVARRTAARYYPDGVEPFDEASLTAAVEECDRLEIRHAALLAEIKRANTGGDKESAAALREELNRVRAEKRAAEQDFKTLSAAFARHRRVSAPYLSSRRLLDRAAYYETLSAPAGTAE
ncbi:MAG: MFS transporter [Clostridia bacterium]|nr:MFS transporter [Clostridia bacterium]